MTRSTISEEVLDTPNRQTLWMLGAVAGATLLMWGMGRGACNYHPPRETRKPRVATTAELARNPKDAAIEMQHRWATHNFSGALELASGGVAQQVQRELQACEADADACEKKRNDLTSQVITTGVLLERAPTGARARVSSRGPGAKTETYLVELEQSGPLWKVRSRVRQ
jgi:hypothetical protein